ncbi:hypothetical protein L3Q82_008719, partial [Scortum barcoo]
QGEESAHHILQETSQSHWTTGASQAEEDPNVYKGTTWRGKRSADSERETFLSSLHQAKQSLSSRYMILTSNDTTVEGNYVSQHGWLVRTLYDLYVWMHYYSAKRYAGSEDNAAHRGPAFIFWHRVFLLFMEQEIRELTGNQDFYIPYWDWTRTNHFNICTNKYFGGVGQDGCIYSASLFSKWKTICPFEESLGIICIHSDPSDPQWHNASGFLRGGCRTTVKWLTLTVTRSIQPREHQQLLLGQGQPEPRLQLQGTRPPSCWSWEQRGRTGCRVSRGNNSQWGPVAVACSGCIQCLSQYFWKDCDYYFGKA